MTTVEFTPVESAQMAMDELTNRAKAIEERQAAIPGLLEEQQAKLGIAIVGKLAAGAIHKEIDRLERERRELDAEALALAPHYARAEKALALALAEEAREKYAALAADVVTYPRKIYDNLHAAFADLQKMQALQDEMREAEQTAGRLAPITIRPVAGVFIPQGAAQMVEAAYYAVFYANVEALRAEGVEVE